MKHNISKIKLGNGRVLMIQPKDKADKQLDAYELEREINALTEPELPVGFQAHDEICLEEMILSR